MAILLLLVRKLNEAHSHANRALQLMPYHLPSLHLACLGTGTVYTRVAEPEPPRSRFFPGAGATKTGLLRLRPKRDSH